MANTKVSARVQTVVVISIENFHYLCFCLCSLLRFEMGGNWVEKVDVGKCSILSAWHTRLTIWLGNWLSETRNSGAPSLLVQLSVRAAITSSWVFPVMATAITKDEKLLATPWM